MYTPLADPRAFTHTHTHAERHLHIHVQSALLLYCLLCLFCRASSGRCVRLSISPPPLLCVRACVCVCVCVAIGLGVDFDICFVWLIHTNPPINRRVFLVFFYHLFSQVSVFIVWTLCIALQWFLNGRSCLVGPLCSYNLFACHRCCPSRARCLSPPLLLFYSDFIAAYFTANKISTP